MKSELDRIIPAGSIQINQKVYDLKRKGVDVTVLSLGESFFEIPLFSFAALDYNKGYHYSDTRGLPGLRDKICTYYKNHYGVESNKESNILISAGSKVLVYMTIYSLIQKGDEVIVHEPYWVSYPEQIKLCHGTPVLLSFDTKISEFKKHITKKTKLIILNNPNNPAGSVYSKTDLLELIEIAKDNNLHLLIDEAYSDFILDNSFTSIGSIDPEFSYCIIINSLSKNMGMSGWRIGYVISNPEVINNIEKMNQHLITCAPTLLMQYCEKYFEDILKHTLPQVREVVEKRERIQKYMDLVALKHLPGSSTFYFFIDISHSGLISTDFALQLLNLYNIAVVPGSFYGKSTEFFVRVGIGAEPDERIKDALKVIKYLGNL